MAEISQIHQEYLSESVKSIISKFENNYSKIKYNQFLKIISNLKPTKLKINSTNFNNILTFKGLAVLDDHNIKFSSLPRDCNNSITSLYRKINNITYNDIHNHTKFKKLLVGALSPVLSKLSSQQQNFIINLFFPFAVTMLTFILLQNVMQTTSIIFSILSFMLLIISLLSIFGITLDVLLQSYTNKFINSINSFELNEHTTQTIFLVVSSNLLVLFLIIIAILSTMKGFFIIPITLAMLIQTSILFYHFLIFIDKRKSDIFNNLIKSLIHYGKTIKLFIKNQSDNSKDENKSDDIEKSKESNPENQDQIDITF